ncbi:MAG: YigZ family protein, partial [Bacillota bacterium]|nr:YigZ family protein [Bacillota bacterium]
KLKDTVVVVTRYFGGIKLGAGGLIRAYGKSVSEGINEVGIVERTLTRIMHTTIDYTWLGKVENELRTSAYSIKDIHYLENVEIEIFIKEEECGTFIDWMTELTNGQASISQKEQIYLEIEVSSDDK